ncbi:hypothetical protein B0H19DRAFT_95704 [Mycena capillaripes]|nr:hypothetical protein B0H19DRAFT_95704 [Mycena capillaripes]
MLGVLEADRTHVANLETQILVLERALLALQTEKALVQERLDSYKYPVLTLPSEIVSEIFLHFLPTYPGRPPLTGLFSPTVLTHICHKWREIAIATPMLWRAITFSERHSHIFKTWLNRSGCCPLAFNLVDWNASTEVFASATLHCARWEYFKLTLYRSPSDLHSLDGPMPLLRYLDLSLGVQSDPIVTVALREVPLLRTVIFDASAAASVTLPWAQLTSLTLKGIYPRECIPVLQQTSELLYCRVNLYCPEDDQLPLPDIRLVHLETLVLSQSGSTAITGYLETLIAPALCSLQIPEVFLDPNPIDSLTAFISKSGCDLKSVDITGTISIPEDSESYRRAFPSIQNLLLNGWSCDPNNAQ